jgi:hypothetical protein
VEDLGRVHSVRRAPLVLGDALVERVAEVEGTLLAVVTCFSRAQDCVTWSRSSSGSNAARLASTSARKEADGTPLETIVCAAAPGKSTAFCSATIAPYECPSTA